MTTSTFHGVADTESPASDLHAKLHFLFESQNERRVARSAFYLNGAGGPIFAWFHQLETSPTTDRGVVICPPIGYEQLHSHRTLRHLADRLAQTGIPTLRFDWHGTGDSSGCDEDPERYSAWMSNIRQAVEWMRKTRGIQQISLIGLRIGGTLASLAAESLDVDNLVLWSPVVKGRTYVRETKALGLTSDAPSRPSAVPSADYEAGGFVLTAETASELSSIDLAAARPRCQRVLIVSRSDMSADDRLSQEWTRARLIVEQIACPGYAEMMADPHRGEVPHTAITEITEWLARSMSEQLASVSEPITRPHALPRSTGIPSNTSPSTTAISVGPGIRESTLPIHHQPDLFGILTSPENISVSAPQPLIILLNSGAAYRIGCSRLHVLIARQLASQGFRCLRMDLNGLGDSVSDGLSDENDSYSKTMFRDIDLTLSQVQRDLGAKKIVLMGLCSGAYAAFQSAAQLTNPALVESILINPLTYFWTDGMTLETAATKDLMEFHKYHNALFDPRRWWRLVSGQSEIGVAGAVNLLARRLSLLKRSRPASSTIQPTSKPINSISITHPLREDLPGDLTRIEKANRHLAMFFSTSDPGYTILNCKARRKAKQRCAAGGLEIQFIENADHTFTIRAARNELIQKITRHLSDRYR